MYILYYYQFSGGYKCVCKLVSHSSGNSSSSKPICKFSTVHWNCIIECQDIGDNWLGFADFERTKKKRERFGNGEWIREMEPNIGKAGKNCRKFSLEEFKFFLVSIINLIRIVYVGRIVVAVYLACNNANVDFNNKALVWHFSTIWKYFEENIKSRESKKSTRIHIVINI